MPDSPSFTDLDAYLAGSASPQLRETIERWIEDAPGRRLMLDALRTEAQAGQRDWNVDAAWTRVSSTLEREAVTPLPAHSAPAATRRPRHAWRVAAVLLASTGAALLWPRTQANRTERLAASPAAHEVTAPLGQRVSLRLADGSSVTLNAGSRLRYDSVPGGARNVWLDGEAYFDVRHDASRPFRVHAQGRVAEDVGTRFVVRAYPGQPRVDVAVAEGAVRVHAAGAGTAPAMVTAGMRATLPAAGATVVTALQESDRYFAFTRGELSLDGQTLREAIPSLERWYGVTVLLPDSTLGARRVLGTFRQETAAQAFAAIALALDATSRQTGRSVTLAPRAHR